MIVSRRGEVLGAIGDSGVLPLFHCDDVEHSVRITAALAEGGARAIEFTDRGPNARRVFAELVAQAARPGHPPRSRLDPDPCRTGSSPRVRFIVGPTFDADVAALCNLRRVPYLPGCATPTEIVTAEKSGVEFVKVFPGEILGPAFVRAIRGPLPEAQVVVAGGVAATEPSVREWISAGAAALGFGSGSCQGLTVLTPRRWPDGGPDPLGHARAPRAGR
jgi:2-dehydro-3-deoxyphosphogluconate aldolase/(4S)-4-hydroxy-2-oxoglutarate aldolase